MRIAPNMEFGNLHRQVNFSGSPAGWPWWQPLQDGSGDIVSKPTKMYKCPSDPRGDLFWDSGDGHKASLTTYLGVNGINQFKEAGGQNGMLYVNSSVKLTHIPDGTSNTLFVGERPPSENLLYGWQWAGAGDYPRFGATDVVLGVRERPLDPGNDPDFYRPGELFDPNDEHRYHFWSLHTGGGNWLLADGSVHFISYAAGTRSIGTSGLTVLEAMATTNGGEVFDHP